MYVATCIECVHTFRSIDNRPDYIESPKTPMTHPFNCSNIAPMKHIRSCHRRDCVCVQLGVKLNFQLNYATFSHRLQINNL